MDRSIIVEDLVKEFVVVDRGSGVSGVLRSIVSPKRRTVVAVKNVSFSLKEGELVGFIGANGAGKTTTLKILSGVLHPSSGYVQVAGFTPWDRNPKFLKQIALVMGQKNQLWWDLPAKDTFELNRAIYEVPRKKYKKTLSELVELLGLEKLLDVQVRRLSLGQRMRLELVAALLHNPKIIFLDEPTIGLDVVAQDQVRSFIERYNKLNEATIILTSHNMDDVAKLAKRVIVIDKGEVYFDGNLSELTQQFVKDKIIKLSLGDSPDLRKLEKIGKIVHVNMPEVVIAVPRGMTKMAASEVLQSFNVVDLTIEEEPIESVIRRVFKSQDEE
ncbi:ATP-binding cassette domain-containing protein [Candidatus Microgenomates bacterium]|nr:MAG: ATP-binding cassette domain-containing protein [Candidatus Microgenomates bacterium]